MQINLQLKMLIVCLSVQANKKLASIKPIKDSNSFQKELDRVIN